MALTKPKKVLIVTHYYPPHTGGIEYVACNQAQCLAAQGHIVTVVTSQIPAHEHSCDKDGVTIVRIKALNSFEKWGVPFPVFSLRLITTLSKAIREAEIVHVHDAFYMSSWFAATIAKIYRRPLVLTQHVDLVPHNSRTVKFVQQIVYATAGKAVFRSSNVIIILNERVKLFLMARGVNSAKIRFVSNGIDRGLFHPTTIKEKQLIRKRYGLSRRKKIVLFVGRLVPKKGFDKVLAAESELYQLVFVGDSPGRNSSSNVRFLGNLPQLKLSEVYRAADLFVLPARGEGFPLTIQEAMASGLPVIMAHDAGYAPYELNDVVCWLNQQSADEAVQMAIKSLIADETRLRRMRDSSLAYIGRRFSWPQTAAELDQIYSVLLARKEKSS